MTVLITGASSGIGQALASHYLDRGAVVAAIARRPIGLQAFRRADGRLATFAADVTDRARMDVVISEVERRLGPIRLAIACAGAAEHETGPGLAFKGLDLMLLTNAVGTLNTLAPVAALMRSRGHGHIVAISSLAALHGIPLIAGYCMSKAALENGMQSLRHALQGSGVRVSVIAPGFIATGMTAGRVSPVFSMPLDRAVQRIIAAIDRRRRVYRFPLWQHVGIRILPLLTARAQNSLLQRLTPLQLSAALAAPGTRLSEDTPHHG